MARHSDSSAFNRYLQNTIHDFVAPIEDIAWANWEEGDDTPDAYEIVRTAFWLISGHFANADGNISDTEVAFF